MPESPDLLTHAEEAYRLAVADPTTAGPMAADVVNRARRHHDVEALVVALRAQAWADRTHLAGEHAKTRLDEAARLARKAGLDTRLGEVLVSRSAVNQELGRIRSARRDLQAARPLLRGARLAELDHQTAVIQHNAGRLREAAEIYRRVLANPDAPEAIQAKATNNLGLIEADLGHHEVALKMLDRARRLAESVGPALAAYFSEGHAVTLAHAGMLPASLEMFELADRLYQEAGLPRAELFTEFADTMADLRLIPEAAQAAARGRDEFRANRIPLMQAEAELRVARLALLSGDAAGAEAAGAQAADEFHAQGRTGWAASAEVLVVEAKVRAGSVSADDLRRVRRAARTLERMEMLATAVDAHIAAGRVACAMDRKAQAQESFDRASSLSRRGSVLIRLRGHLAAAESARVRDDHATSLHACPAGLRDLERHRNVLASTELRVLASAHGAEFGRIGLATLLKTGTASDVLRWLERTRAAALVAVQRPAVAGLEEELAELHALQAGSRAGVATVEETARQTALEDRIRRSTWAATAQADSPVKPAPLGEVRRALGDRTLVEYGVLDDEVFAVVMTSKRLSLVHLGCRRFVEPEVRGLLFCLRVLSRCPAGRALQAAMSAARTRIAHLREFLALPLAVPGDGELVVIPVGALQRVPWSVMHAGPTTVAPSAAVWMRARERMAPPDRRTVLVAGPDLAWAGEEVVRLSTLHRDARVLLPPDSTVSGVGESLGDAELAHFACHGTIRADNPLFSGLSLSDGLLTVQELDLRGVAPRRVVLAACEAAADVAYPGDEMLGFVSALMARGTAGVVASLLLVPDSAAIPLMERLHGHLAHHRCSEALFAARKALDQDDPTDFVNWCGFTAFGAA